MSSSPEHDDLSLLTLSELACRIESHRTEIRHTEHSRLHSDRTRETIQNKREFATKTFREANELEAMLDVDSGEIIEGHQAEIARCKAAKLVVQLNSVGVIAEASKICKLSEENIKQIKELIGETK